MEQDLKAMGVKNLRLRTRGVILKNEMHQNDILPIISRINDESEV